MIAHDQINPDFWNAVTLGVGSFGFSIQCGRCKKTNLCVENPQAEHGRAAEVYHYGGIKWSKLDDKIIVAGCTCMADVRWEEDVWNNRRRIMQLGIFIARRLKAEKANTDAFDAAVMTYLRCEDFLPGRK